LKGRPSATYHLGIDGNFIDAVSSQAGFDLIGRIWVISPFDVRSTVCGSA
jgi:hypothetical protein